MNKTIMPIFMILMITLFSGLVAASCSTSGITGTASYTGVTVNSPGTTTFTSNQQFLSYSSITPAANGTLPVNDTLIAGLANTTSAFNWKTGINFSSSLVLKNGSTTLGAGNYTLTNTSANTWVINWTNSNYNGNTISAFFNRTFTTSDDFVAGPASIYTGASTGSFLTITTPSGSGGQSTVAINNAVPGIFLNNTNLSSTYTYNNQSCIGIDAATQTGIQNTQTAAYAAFALIALMIIVFAAWAVIHVLQTGNSAELFTVGAIIIGGAIIIMVAYIIIFYVATALI